MDIRGDCDAVSVLRLIAAGLLLLGCRKLLKPR